MIAFGLAVEGLKKPMNPATNFRQGEMAKKNHSFEKMWDKWGYTLKLVAVAWLCYLTAGIVRSSIATELDDQSYSLVKSQAKKIAKVRKYSPSKIKKYVKTQKKKVSTVKLYSDVQDIISPSEILSQLSTMLPSNNRAKKYDIRHFAIKEDKLSIHGAADSAQLVQEIEKKLKSLSSNNKFEKIKSTIPKENGRTTFSYSISVKRKG